MFLSGVHHRQPLPALRTRRARRFDHSRRRRGHGRQGSDERPRFSCIQRQSRGKIGRHVQHHRPWRLRRLPRNACGAMAEATGSAAARDGRQKGRVMRSARSLLQRSERVSARAVVFATQWSVAVEDARRVVLVPPCAWRPAWRWTVALYLSPSSVRCPPPRGRWQNTVFFFARAAHGRYGRAR